MWDDEAACRTADPTVFFERAGSLHDEARRICGACSVRALCLSAALDAERGETAQHRYGIFGGLNGRERFALANR
jgi:WhiB family redox-sensing transcriptional regulator